MKRIDRIVKNRFSLFDAMRARITSHLDDIYLEDEGMLGELDRWTQRHITKENIAKLSLVLNSNDPAEACYKDLIREIDTEAETGIYLVNPESPSSHLRRLADEAGVSGDLRADLTIIAPIVFADVCSDPTNDSDQVWIMIEATHARAHVDADVSEIIMSYFLDDTDGARDMSNALRALQYSFHEDAVRRRCELPCILNDRDSNDLAIMVDELAKRSGNYPARVAAIREQSSSN
jgi:hypothetical protein